jgi:RimJ/RimL family protein N-acetyltransferase
MDAIIFTTQRLYVRIANTADADFLFQLWKNPVVMTNVGFPQGLRTSREEIVAQIKKHAEPPFNQVLIACLKDGTVIGQCKMTLPNENGISTTDVKLHPDYWGHRYGVEIKGGLLEYLFRKTGCIAVEATPNVQNIASIKMQEAVGGIRIGEDVYNFPETMQEYTKSVHHYIYRVYRKDWNQKELRF